MAVRSVGLVLPRCFGIFVWKQSWFRKEQTSTKRYCDKIFDR